MTNEQVTGTSEFLLDSFIGEMSQLIDKWKDAYHYASINFGEKGEPHRKRRDELWTEMVNKTAASLLICPSSERGEVIAIPIRRFDSSSSQPEDFLKGVVIRVVELRVDNTPKGKTE